MRRELLVELSLGNDGTLAGLGADGKLQFGDFLRGLVVDLGGGEVEVTEGLWSHHSDVGHIGLRGNAIDGSRQLTSNDGECLGVETVVNCLKESVLANF